MRKIHEERPELAGDPVARREVLGRLVDLRGRIEVDLQRMFDTAEWYRAGHAPVRYSAAELNGLASAIADERFPAAPRLPNELLNRLKPSSNAIAAQKALLKRMVQAEGQPRLGIEGFPAEGGLFDSLLAKAGLYLETPDHVWHFAGPSKQNDPCGLLGAWKAATALLEHEAHRTVNISEVYRVWRQQPYGIKEGLLPILAVALVLVHRDRLALYREGIFQARFTDLDVDYLTTDAALIQLRWMVLSDLSRQLLSGLAEVVRNLDCHNRLIHLEPIDVARGLVAIFDNLKPWTKRTSRLSANAVRVRSLFKHASDPNKFLFDDIPSLFGNTAGDDKGCSPEAVLQILGRVSEGLEELTRAYGDMLRRLQDLMLAELHVPNDSPQSLAELRGRAENIRNLGGDFRLNAFVSRLCQFSGAEEEMEGITSLVLNKPTREWSDADLDQGSVEIADLAQRSIRAESFARVKGRTDKRQALAVVVGLNGRPTPVSGEFDITDKDCKVVEGLVARIESTLRASSDQVGENVILAALAQLIARVLLDKDEDQSRKKLGPNRVSS